MTAKNTLTKAPPYAVESAIKRLGANLRTARLRRNLTIEVVGEKIGTGPGAVTDAEKGKVTTSIAVYTALLWAYDLLGPWDALDEMEQIVKNRWRPIARNEGATHLDCERISGAFAYEGFRG